MNKKIEDAFLRLVSKLKSMFIRVSPYVYLPLLTKNKSICYHNYILSHVYNILQSVNVIELLSRKTFRL